MKSRIEIKKTFTLELTEDEASWLREIVRNPIHTDNPQKEENRDREMRRLFFNSLLSED